MPSEGDLTCLLSPVRWPLRFLMRASGLFEIARQTSEFTERWPPVQGRENRLLPPVLSQPSSRLARGPQCSYVSPDVRQADDTYRELAKLIPKEDIAIWTGGHDAGSTLEVIRSKHDGFEPTAPRFKKAQLESYRVAIISHAWYLSTQGVHGALSYDGQPRTLHLIDERLSEVKLSDLGLADVIDARDTIISQRGDKDPLAVALTALAVYMDHVWETERSIPGAAFKALSNDKLEWFMSDESATEERRAFSQKKVADAIAFGRSLVTGHAFMARYQRRG